MYIIQVPNLFANWPLVKTWSSPPLSTMVSTEIEKVIRRNKSLLFVKTSALSLDSQSNSSITKAKSGQINSNKA